MTEFEMASLTARYVIGGGQVLIGLGQIAVVWYFGRQMVRANKDRSQAGERQDQALQGVLKSLEAQTQALQTLVARTAGERGQA